MKAILITIATAAVLSGWLLWPYMWHGFFYQCIALQTLSLSIALHLPGKTKYCTFIQYLHTGIAVSILYDELFTNPKALGWHEILFITVVAAIAANKVYGKQ